MYMLLSAHYPFWSRDDQELEDLICNSDLKFDYPSFTQVPESAKDLMTKMLDKIKHHPNVVEGESFLNIF